MSTEKQDVKPEAPELAARLAAARKRMEKNPEKREEQAMNGKKEDPAGGIAALSELFRERLEIGDMLDQVIDELGVQFGLLVKVQTAIGKKLYATGVCPGNHPAWIGELTSAEILRNRLAAEVAEHSSGGGNESVFGRVTSRETLASIFAKHHVGLAERAAAPRLPSETTEQYYKRIGAVVRPGRNEYR